ncbi:hypothetical protein C0Q70_00064 [Pomacea canaliculata]|uniref:HTTM-like domain-containing protein n=1 Tax=Pomacea canaliculata TaxID=400727 RepID=A0A2T7PVM3_POMCA|nr:hypothetical protein C0Q70_00064 [Pomacea canaliculata]
MLLDTLQERGLAAADVRWGDPDECRFPLFDLLRPLPVQWMGNSACGIMLGAAFRVSCVLFLLPYWYMFLLDKATWNNHSYLFGILGFLLFLSDANRYWSLDGLFHYNISNSDVPLWNYSLLRSQIFLVYFLAGLKKLDLDWVGGYSMENLSQHWIFDPFRFVLTSGQVDYFIVHLGGLTIDLVIGFLLFFNKTRLLGFLICSSFHLMNSQLFSIGMFPWMMLATQPLFCNADWPRAVFRRIPHALRLLTPDVDEDTQPSSHCLYPKTYIKPENTPDTVWKRSSHKQTIPSAHPMARHRLAAVFTLMFVVWQVFLPYSHFITKGYNSWTQGLYGYSWDMMVHTRSLQHLRITFVDRDSGYQGYLNPEMWTKSWRWSSHPDMIQQYARFLQGDSTLCTLCPLNPSCYMYIFVNTTEVHFLERLKEFELSLNGSTARDQVPEKFQKDPMLEKYQQMLAIKEQEQRLKQRTVLERAATFLQLKYDMFSRSFHLIVGAVQSIVTDTPFHDFLRELNSAGTPAASPRH